MKATMHGEQQPIKPADLDDELPEAVEAKTKQVRGFAAPSSYWLKENPEADNEQTKSRWRTAHQFLSEADKLSLHWKIAEHAAGWILGLSGFAFFLLFLTALATEGRDGAWHRLLTPFLFIIAGIIGKAGVNKCRTRRRKTQTFLPETLTRILPLLERSDPLQTAYCDAVCALLKPEGAGENPATQTILHDLKTLLQTGRQIKKQRAEIEQAMNHQSLADLETEAVRLADRAEAATDKSARETFGQSLALLEARLNRAKNLEPLRQQLEAQEEVITQALHEAQSALLGANMARTIYVADANGANNAADILPAAWGDTMTRLHNQTQSVEQAVREVMVSASR